MMMLSSMYRYMYAGDERCHVLNTLTIPIDDVKSLNSMMDSANNCTAMCLQPKFSIVHHTSIHVRCSDANVIAMHMAKTMVIVS